MGSGEERGSEVGRLACHDEDLEGIQQRLIVMDDRLRALADRLFGPVLEKQDPYPDEGSGVDPDARSVFEDLHERVGDIRSVLSDVEGRVSRLEEL